MNTASPSPEHTAETHPESVQPIFYDPHARRWRRFRGAVMLLAFVLMAIFGALTFSILTTPALPRLALTPTRGVSPASHVSAGAPTPTAQPTIPAKYVAAPPALPTLPPRATATRVAVPGKATVANPTAQAHRDQAKAAYVEKKATQSARQLGNRFHPAATPTARPPTPRARATPTAMPRATPATFNPVTPTARGRMELVAFFVDWDDASLASLKQNLATIDKLVPEWLHLADARGTLAPDAPWRQQMVIEYIRKHRPDLPIVPLLNNYNAATEEWEGEKLAQMLADPSARARVIQSLFDYVQQNRFAGVCVDFENVPRASQPALKTFMRELYARFHPLGWEVWQTAPVEDGDWDYAAFAQSSDALILMAYDEHWSGSAPGPLASQRWFADALHRRLAQVAPAQCFIGIGNYGYDWLVEAHTGADIAFQRVMLTAEAFEAEIVFDAVSLNPTFNFFDDEGRWHQVWYLDAVTAFNQMAESNRYGARGIALWRLGAEDPSLWRVLEQRARLDKNVANALRELHAGHSIEYEGEGEVLQVTVMPRDGAREIAYDDRLGLVVGERVTAYPSPYVVTRWGAHDPQQIALTFDDGPDARYTPQILDILKEYQVKATFFILGANADLNPGLLERLANEGHEIGNHTFTHPDVSLIPLEQLALELNATQRLLESRIGRRTVLFRPPYGEDIEPETPAQVKPLLYTSQLGYYTIGMQVDPHDYKNLDAEFILADVVDEVRRGEGHVILLHDGGGERSQTVAALPGIIEELRAQGFRFVTISELLGLTREEVMPPLPPSERLLAGVNDAGFQIASAVNGFFYALFALGIGLGVLRFGVIGFLAVGEWLRARLTTYPARYQPSVSVIVPAYNEAKVIGKTLDALLASTYPNLEIIVVDDGSTDDTAARVIARYGDNPRVRVFTKPNEGKARALNFGIQQSRADIVVAQDADTIVLPNAIAKLVRHLALPGIGAVAGNAKVGNRVNLLTEWQALEYITSQNLDRRAFALLNCVTVVPGAIGAWRRALVVELGGFTSDTLAEDADLTLRILRRGYQIDYEEEAIALTEAPDTVRAFLKQRFRWMFGTLQAAWKHRDTLLRPRYGALGFVALPNVLVFQILFPLISPIMDLMVFGSAAALGVQLIQHPAAPASEAFARVLLFYVFFLVLDFLAALLAFALERQEDGWLLFWLFFQRFCYRQLMYYVAAKSTLAALRGRLVGWGKLERKATVGVG